MACVPGRIYKSQAACTDGGLGPWSTLKKREELEETTSLSLSLFRPVSLFVEAGSDKRLGCKSV